MGRNSFLMDEFDDEDYEEVQPPVDEGYFKTTGVVWNSANGPVDIGRMDDSHLANTIEFVGRRVDTLVKHIGASKRSDADMLAKLKAEASRRRGIREMAAKPLNQVVFSLNKEDEDAVRSLLNARKRIREIDA